MLGSVTQVGSCCCFCTDPAVVLPVRRRGMIVMQFSGATAAALELTLSCLWFRRHFGYGGSRILPSDSSPYCRDTFELLPKPHHSSADFVSVCLAEFWSLPFLAVIFWLDCCSLPINKQAVFCPSGSKSRLPCSSSSDDIQLSFLLRFFRCTPGSLMCRRSLLQVDNPCDLLTRANDHWEIFI